VTAYLVITLFAAMVPFSGIGKIRRDPRIVYVINEVVGVPLKYFSLLAANELAGALGLVLHTGAHLRPSRSVALPRLALLCSKLENNAPVGIELGGFLQINAV
jgi:hypothetical protein